MPYPEDKFVNIFRAIYQSDAGKEDFSSFKIAKRDSPPKTMIQDLKPGTRCADKLSLPSACFCRIPQLTGFVRAGTVCGSRPTSPTAGSRRATCRTSARSQGRRRRRLAQHNKVEGPGLAGTSPPLVRLVPAEASNPFRVSGKLEGTPLAEVSDYYGPLVAVAIIATLAILTSLALTLLLLKKCAQSKAAISTCRKSQSAYDNPSYKVEIQQETMGTIILLL